MAHLKQCTDSIPAPDIHLNLGRNNRSCSLCCFGTTSVAFRAIFSVVFVTYYTRIAISGISSGYGELLFSNVMDLSPKSGHWTLRSSDWPAVPSDAYRGKDCSTFTCCAPFPNRVGVRRYVRRQQKRFS